jgi:competence protein ComEA
MFKKLILLVLLGLTPAWLPGVVVAAEAAADSTADATMTSAVNPVNINTADVDALSQGLVGVGQSRAEEIVRYREAYGPFFAVDDLAEVKGIGPSTIDKNRARMTLE